MPEALPQVSPETQAVLDKYVKEKGIEIEEARGILNAIVSIRDRLELMVGELHALLDSSYDHLAAIDTTDSFVREVSGLGQFDIEDLDNVRSTIAHAYKDLLRIAYKRSPTQAKDHEEINAKKENFFGAARLQSGTDRISRAARPQIIHDEATGTGRGNIHFAGDAREARPEQAETNAV